MSVMEGQARFLHMMRDGQEEAVAWDRDVRQEDVGTEHVPRLYRGGAGPPSRYSRTMIFVRDPTVSQEYCYVWTGEAWRLTRYDET